MKKLLSVIICVVFLCTLSVTAFAAPITAPGSSDTTIKTIVEPTYTVTIPANTNITFGVTSTNFGEVELSDANLEVGYAVKVSVTAGELKNVAGDTIDYSVMAGGSDFTSAEYDTAGESTALTIEIEENEWNTAKAGAYEGKVTFTVEYKTAS